MKRILLFFVLILPCIIHAQTINDYFEKIRNNSAELTAFFSQMPKGGDLHHHYSGSVYAETYMNYVIEKNFYINKSTLKISEKNDAPGDDWVTFSSLKDEGSLAAYKQKIIQKWSVKDYNNVDYPSDKLFFETFPNFGIAADATLEKGLTEIKTRAKNENVSYIETMYQGVPCDKNISDLTAFNDLLKQAQANRDNKLAIKILDSLYHLIQKKNITDCAVAYNGSLEKMHKRLQIDDTAFTMRYQNYVLRFEEPVMLFENLVLAFESADKSQLIVGVNIVGAEDNEVSMRDYWLHMQMFNFCHNKYPQVKYAMHAGELALGMVKPEELSWHINAAVYDAHANRIGHGVDIPYERNCYSLLAYMNRNKIPIEINLFSNEFILKVKEDRHPVLLYKKFNVPIVICSDDAAVLRTNLTDQFVLLAKRYKEISYADIKGFVYNSINYSFIESQAMKQQLINDLDRRFLLFEKNIISAF